MRLFDNAKVSAFDVRIVRDACKKNNRINYNISFWLRFSIKRLALRITEVRKRSKLNGENSLPSTWASRGSVILTEEVVSIRLASVSEVTSKSTVLTLMRHMHRWYIDQW